MRHQSKFTSREWSHALLPEVSSARRVLATADRLLRSGESFDAEIDAILATYSIGVERLMKLALGTSAVSRGEGWPKMGSTRDGWGHALDEMDARLQAELATAVRDGDWEHRRLLESWVCTLEKDPVWNAAVRTLRNYADAGRYYHLDQLRGGAVKARSSHEMWNEVEEIAIDTNPVLKALHLAAIRGEGFEEFELAVRATVADAIKRWTSLICLFGLHGVLGEDWQVIGADALPDDAVPVHALPECELTPPSAL